MAENKKSFVLYSDTFGLIKQLPDDVAGRLLKHIYAYVNDENPITDELLVNVAFEPIKAQLKRDLVKWEKQTEQRKQAGLKSAEVRKQNATTVNDRSISSTDNVSVSVNDNVNEIAKATNISIPDWDEFLAYGKEKEPSVKVSALKNKYDAWVVNGWKNGNDKPIKNWKSALLQTLTYIEKEVKPTQREFKPTKLGI
jgi:hypothetical protein